MPELTYNVCPWPVDPACEEDFWASDLAEADRVRAVALASSTLQRLTAYRVGNCTTIIRPCARSVGYQSRIGEFRHWAGRPDWMAPYNWAGTWYNACGCMSNNCGHTETNTVYLPRPMGGVVAVVLNGTTLTAEVDYWVQGNALIAKGSTVWPLTQDLTLPDTSAGTFSVEFYHCTRPDGNAARACALLAMEYAKACTGKGGTCRLPETVTSVVRQGVTYQLESGAFPNGETGIREVDAFIALWNPGHRMQMMEAWAPGMTP